MSKILLSAAVLTTFTGLALLSEGGCASQVDDPRPTDGARDERTATASSALADDAGVKRGQIVISQVFGGGGTVASFQRDFVELFNRSAEAVPLDGLSLQIASATDPFDVVIPLTGSIPAGRYFLVALHSGITGDPLPTPLDLESTEDVSQEDGKVALVPGTTALGCGGPPPRCPTDKLLDLVGYGAASDSEGDDKAPQLGPTTAALRKNNGCTDTDDNSKDFVAGGPAPRNSATQPAPCPPVTQPSKDAGPPAPPVVDPPLGEEAPYDAGVRRDAGGRPGGETSDDGGCALGGSSGAGTPSAALGLISGVVVVLAARRRKKKA